MASQIDFWFSIGSTYSYLSVMRVEDVARKHSVPVRWRPFDVVAIMTEMENFPFHTKPIKLRYMWRDVERRFVRSKIYDAVGRVVVWSGKHQRIAGLHQRGGGIGMG